MRFHAFIWGVATAIIFAAIVVAGVGCYTGTPPCNPGTVDWPRCDPTQPPLRSRTDGGVRG